MPDAVLDRKNVRERPIPPHIGILVHVDEKQESHEDDRETSSKEFLKEKGVLNEVESLGHIHKACIDIGAILHEVVDSLDCFPGAHGGVASRLISKL